MSAVRVLRRASLAAQRPSTTGQQLRIVFVHTPMSTVEIPERQLFWQNFDRRYHATHPGLRHMRRPMWELPHWIPWLGGVLVEAGYTNLGVLDFYSTASPAESLGAESTIRELLANPADIYLFSPMTANLHHAYAIAAMAKQIYPQCTTIFGGVIATPESEAVAANGAVDYVMFGRGEYALPELLAALSGRHSIDRVGNVCYQQADGVIRTSDVQYPWMPVEQIPFPKIDLFPPDAGLDIRYLRLVYGLGCPYKCQMCTIQTIGRRPNYFPVARVLAELDAYRAYYGSHHNVYFGDETFTVDPDRTLELCQSLAERGDVIYDCQTRMNRLSSQPVLDALAASGCHWLEVGIESINQETQDIFKQRVDLKTLRETLRRLREVGLPVCSFLVNGFPNQTEDDMRRSIDQVCDLIADGLLQASYLFGLVPYPGSDIYSRPERYGMKIRHRNYQLYHEDLPPVFDTEYTDHDSAYEAFLYGLTVLGEAMAQTPYLGTLAESVDVSEFGSFWAGAHV